MIGKENEATLISLRDVGLTRVAKEEKFVGRLPNGNHAEITIHDFGVSPGYVQDRFLVDVRDTDGHATQNAFGVSLKAALMGIAWDLFE